MIKLRALDPIDDTTPNSSMMYKIKFNKFSVYVNKLKKIELDKIIINLPT